MEFPKKVTIERKVSENIYGDVTYGTPSSQVCNYFEQIRLEDNKKLMVARMFFPLNTVIGEKDKITLEDGETSPIVFIEKHDYGSNPFLEVFLGEVRGDL